MNDRRSRISKMRDFVREAKDFILAINQGATARELEKIRSGIRGKQDRIPVISDAPPIDRRTKRGKTGQGDHDLYGKDI